MIYNYESAHLHLTVGVKTVLETVKLSSGLPDEAFKQLKQFEAKQRAGPGRVCCLWTIVSFVQPLIP